MRIEHHVREQLHKVRGLMANIEAEIDAEQPIAAPYPEDLQTLKVIDAELADIGRVIAATDYRTNPTAFMALCRKRQHRQNARRDFIEARRSLVEHLSAGLRAERWEDYRQLKRVERALGVELAEACARQVDPWVDAWEDGRPPEPRRVLQAAEEAPAWADAPTEEVGASAGPLAGQQARTVNMHGGAT